MGEPSLPYELCIYIQTVVKQICMYVQNAGATAIRRATVRKQRCLPSIRSRRQRLLLCACVAVRVPARSVAVTLIVRVFCVGFFFRAVLTVLECSACLAASSVVALAQAPPSNAQPLRAPRIAAVEVSNNSEVKKVRFLHRQPGKRGAASVRIDVTGRGCKWMWTDVDGCG